MDTEFSQNSFQWGMHRIGRWNASEIWQLMKPGRGKDAMFGQTALTYIEEVAAQRGLDDLYKSDVEFFKEYDNLVSVSSKFTEWGHEQEDVAAMNFALTYGYDLQECGSVDHPTIQNLSASPDRIAVKDGVKEILEIKCPLPKAFGKYRMEIHDTQDLLGVKPEYYYQVQAQMCCTGITMTNLVFWCPFMRSKIHRIRVAADRNVFAEFATRIGKAEEMINTLWTE